VTVDLSSAEIASVDRSELDPRQQRAVSKKLIVGGTIVLIYVVAAICAPLIVQHGPNTEDVVMRLAPPDNGYLLGTDQLGRDVFARLIYSIRVDLPIGIAGVLLPMTLGTLLGAYAGFHGGVLDSVIGRVADVIQAFPIYVFMIALVFALGSGVRAILISFTAVGWVIYARLIRGEILRLKGLEYIQAAHTAGLSSNRILWRHAMPNAIRQSIVYSMSDVVQAIVILASLTFFGLGVAPPTPEWGSMIADGQPYLVSDPILAIAPGIAIMIIGLGLSLIGDGLDDSLRR
jgi:peptide/nickel transport system permease protein